MDWSTEEISEQRPLIQALSSLKFDEYQQFSLGTRFIESLVKWLDQFEKPEEKRTAYNFIKEHLIFISGTQMLHLVGSTFSEKINPVLIKYAADKMNIEEFRLAQILHSEEYKKGKRSTLFIGLSDGARMDQLRRSCKLNNEQVVPTYSIDEDKVKDMLEKLMDEQNESYFSSIFLIDDFTASGTSYFRKNEKDEWKGKIFKTVKSLITIGAPQHALIKHDQPLNVHVVFYIATQEALDFLKRMIEEWLDESSQHDIKIHLDAIQIIGPEIKEKILRDTNFISLAEKYFDESIIDSHYEVGKHVSPYLGFNECALPLILLHNTPNNSLPLLWDPGDGDFEGLFPRTKRHRDQE
jgi:hypothetical protein